MITLSYLKVFTVEFEHLSANTEAYSEPNQISKMEFFVEYS